jgi:hypothetical protein
MTTRAAAAPTRKPAKDLVPFEKGQVWRIGDLNLAVISVGKTLVHHKTYTTQPKGIQITLTSKSDLRKYLMNAKAVLTTAVESTPQPASTTSQRRPPAKNTKR